MTGSRERSGPLRDRRVDERAARRLGIGIRQKDVEHRERLDRAEETVRACEHHVAVAEENALHVDVDRRVRSDRLEVRALRAAVPPDLGVDPGRDWWIAHAKELARDLKKIHADPAFRKAK